MQNSDAVIYIVDDDDRSRNSVRALVATMGLSALTYASAEEFLKEYHGEPGCLVTDLRMPGKNGVELLEALQQSGRMLPAIVITAFAEISVAVEAMQKGAVTLLEKPYRENELWTAIREALDRDFKQRSASEERRRIQARLNLLTPRERTVLDMVLNGDPNKAIAIKLKLSIRTVEGCRRQIFEKMNVESVARLVQDVMVANAGKRPKQGNDEP